jgi:hypothetical protein
LLSSEAAIQKTQEMKWSMYDDKEVAVFWVLDQVPDDNLLSLIQLDDW